MITEITIENFKSFGSPQTIPLKPITLLYGPNSSGKSSIIQFLLMLKQTMESSGDDHLLIKGDSIELGDFKNIIHKHNIKNNLRINFKFKLESSEFIIKDIKNKKTENDFNMSCIFKLNLNKPEIDSIQYRIPGYESPIVSFTMSNQIKESKIKINRWAQNSIINKEDTFNIYDFINPNHPSLKKLYEAMASNIKTIIIPIKINLQRIFGANIKNADLIKMSCEKFILGILNKSKKQLSEERKILFIKNLKKFYIQEVSILINKYLQYTDYSFETFLNDLEYCAGKGGFVNLNNFIFKTKFDEDAFLNSIGLNEFTGERLIRKNNKDKMGIIIPMNNLNKLRLKPVEAFFNEIDPIGLFSNEARQLRLYASGHYDQYEEYGIELEGNELAKYKKIAQKLLNSSNTFSAGLDISKLTPYKIFTWYEQWGHLGSEKNDKLSFSNDDELRNYRFSKYYDSISDYINYVNSKYIRLNLRGLIKDVFKEVSEFLNSMEHIAPLRALPERYYIEKGKNESDKIGKGDNVPEMIRGSREIENKLNIEFKKLGIEYKVSVKREFSNSVLKEAFSIDLFDKRLGTNVNLKDLGQGISQVIPIVMAGILPNKKFIVIEQPEIHIHPRLQAELGKFIAEQVYFKWSNKIILKNKQFIIETHSEALMLRLQKLIRNKVLKPEDVAVVYVEKDGGESVCRELRLDENGEFLDAWPGGFFEESYNEMFK